jgi:conjugative relaxase-like TrwC/TraI family protein
VTNGSGRYYLEPVRLGAEPAGYWLGGGASGLGLTGEVTEGQLPALLEGRHPQSGVPLRARATRVRGWDLTATAAKSVSVLWALTDAETAAAVEAAERAAATAAIGYLETALDPDAGSSPLIAAGFFHRTSRSGDPHLHTHLVVANLAFRGGRWRALDSKALGAHASTAGLVYQCHLRWEMSRRLSLTWAAVGHGAAQVEEVPSVLLGAFSQRRAQVQAGMRAHGGRSPTAAQVAALDGRPPRSDDVSVAARRHQWEHRAGELGTSRIGVLPRDPVEGPPSLPEALDPTDLLFDLSSFSQKDVVAAVCSGATAGLPVQTVLDVARRYLASDKVRELEKAPVLRHGDVMRVGPRIIPVGTDQRRWVTAPSAAVERDLAECASRSGELLIVDLSSASQRNAAVGESARRWTSLGYRVLAAAGSEEIRRESEAASGVPFRPAGELLQSFCSLRHPPLVPTMVLVAGAEELGAQALLNLVRAAEVTGAPLALFGHAPPFPTADRYGGWRSLAHLGRQPNQILPGPVGLAEVMRTENLVMAADSDRLRDAMVQDWLGLPPGSVMAARRREDQADLNHRAQRALQGAGRLSGEPWPLDGLEIWDGDRILLRCGRAPGLTLWHRTGMQLEGPGAARLERNEIPPGAARQLAYAVTPYQALRLRAEKVLLLADAEAIGPVSHRRYLLARPEDMARQRLAWDPPEPVLALLGPPPPGWGRQEWDRAAAAVESYRQRWSISDEETGLGPPPGDALQKAQRKEVERALHSLRRLAREHARQLRPTPSTSHDIGRELGRSPGWGGMT